MVVTVPLRSIFGAFIWFLIIGLPIAIFAQMIVEWRITLFIVLLFAFAAVLAVSLSKGFDAYYRRQPGTVQHRLHRVSEAAYWQEAAVQAQLGATGGNGRWAAKQAAKQAVEAEKELIADERANAAADERAERDRRATEAASAAAEARARAERRAARYF